MASANQANITFMDISFIIPAYNEAKNIENVVHSIKRYTPGMCRYEVLVVDHGSEDDTASLAKACGARVLVHPEGTIAGLRNFGVSNSAGTILVFLDADIRLTRGWELNIEKVVSSLSAGERLLTGSWYSVPDNPNWLEKFRFKPLERGDNSHINSGHLIIARELFDDIGGFDGVLETGEDYDISIRAKNAGIRLKDDVSLRVIHEGYPKSLLEFMKREFWHGKGDALSLACFFQSKVAVVSLVFVTLHVALLLFAFVGNEKAAYAVLTGIAGISAGMAYLKYKTEPVLAILVNSFIYYVYFWARGLSVLSLPGFRRMRKRMR